MNLTRKQFSIILGRSRYSEVFILLKDTGCVGSGGQPIYDLTATFYLN